MENIMIRSIVLPVGVRGVTVVDENGDYNVYINCTLSPDVQKQAADHELRHIRKDHFYDFEPVARNEREADAG